MSGDVVTVPADTLHAILALFARIEHLAKSHAVRDLRDAIPEQDRARVQLMAFGALVPVLRRALGVAISEARHAQNLKDLRLYEETLEALGGSEDDSDE